MEAKERIKKEIDKKQVEIDTLEIQIREAKAYIRALQDAIKLLPRDTTTTGSVAGILRPGSLVWKARRAIKRAGKPIHVTEIVEDMKLANNKKNRTSVSGSLASYFRKGEIFTRPAANTYGLKEWGDSGEDLEEDSQLESNEKMQRTIPANLHFVHKE